MDFEKKMTHALDHYEKGLVGLGEFMNLLMKAHRGSLFHVRQQLGSLLPDQYGDKKPDIVSGVRTVVKLLDTEMGDHA